MQTLNIDHRYALDANDTPEMQQVMAMRILPTDWISYHQWTWKQQYHPDLVAIKSSTIWRHMVSQSNMLCAGANFPKMLGFYLTTEECSRTFTSREYWDLIRTNQKKEHQDDSRVATVGQQISTYQH